MKRLIAAAIFLFVAWAAGPPAWSEPPSGDSTSLDTQYTSATDTEHSPELEVQNCTSAKCDLAVISPQASPEVLAAAPTPAPATAASVSEVRTWFRSPERDHRSALDHSFYAKMEQCC